ncbi:hypothetical protein [Ancrocorticia sp.]
MTGLLLFRLLRAICPHGLGELILAAMTSVIWQGSRITYVV